MDHRGNIGRNQAPFHGDAFSRSRQQDLNGNDGDDHFLRGVDGVVGSMEQGTNVGSSVIRQGGVGTHGHEQYLQQDYGLQVNHPSGISMPPSSFSSHDAQRTGGAGTVQDRDTETSFGNAISSMGTIESQGQQEGTMSTNPEQGVSSTAVGLPPPARATPPARGGARAGRVGTVSLALLIEEGFLEPGEDVLSVEYKGETYYGNLLPDGRISCPRHLPHSVNEPYESPSRFSVEIKQITNPTRKADDGWKSIKYQGRFLEHYKHEYLRQKFPGEVTFPTLEPRAAKRARMSTDYASLGGGLSTGFRFGRPTEAVPQERPRRVRRAPPRFAAIGVDDEHALQPLQDYPFGKQPFKVRVTPAAVAMMDYHAHLCMNEVIGILAGKWNPATKQIDVIRAYPVQELATEDDSINVEMCPKDQVARMNEAEEIGLKMVGWYHSHPSFPTLPSTIDVYNQVLQQHAHRQENPTDGSQAPTIQSPQLRHAGTTGDDSKTAIEPYIAAIVGPYDPQLPSAVSSVTWFYVDHRPGIVPMEGQRPDEVGCIPKALVTEELLEPLGQLDNLISFQKDMEQLAKRYAELPDRADLESLWRDDKTCVDKLVDSVLSRFPRDPKLLDPRKLETFAVKLGFSTRAVWSVYGKPLSSAAIASDIATGSPGACRGAMAPISVTNSEGAPRDDADDEPISDDETV